NSVATRTFDAVLPPSLLEATLPAAGTYVVALGGNAAAGPSSYSFRAVLAQTTTQPLTPGTTVSDALVVPSDVDRYTFTLAAPARVYFDALSNSGLLGWTLTGPSGTLVSNRAFNATDGSPFSTNPVLNLPAGDYTVTIASATNATGGYQFRLLDVGAATPLTPGTPVSGTLSPANETDLYRFTAAAGDRFFFDVQARSGATGATWRLID